MPDADLDVAIDLNVKAMIRTIRAVLPGMLERRRRRHHQHGLGRLQDEGRAEPLRLRAHQGGGDRAHQGGGGRLRRPNIRCNAICPGTVESPSLQERIRAQGDYEQTRAAFIARQPIGRLGTPEEIADLAVYLAGATYTTGQAVTIDGGWTI